MYRVLVQNPPKPKPPIPVAVLPPRLQALYDVICTAADHGDRLPTVFEFAALYGVTVPRISQMMSELCNRGFIERAHPPGEKKDRYVFTVIDTGKTTA